MSDRERDMRLIERAEYAASIEEARAVRYRSHADMAGDSMTRYKLDRRADQRELNAQRAREIAEEARTRLRATEQRTPVFITALRRWKEQ